MPPPPQSPYAQQPPQAPGPYGPPHPQQHPYPQQQPYGGPQPYPPQPYPPQPYPGWGMPPMGPPPKRRRIGLVLGIVGGVVGLGVAGLVLLGVLIDSGFPAAKNRLTLPQQLLGGTYTLAEDLSDTAGQKVEDEADGAWDARDVHAVVGRYSPGGDGSKGSLLVSGMYGRFKNQDDVRRSMLRGAAGAEGVTVDEPAQDVTPPGADVRISCEVLTQKRGLVTVHYPACAWSDGNTAAIVGEVDLTRNAPTDVDLHAAARHTLEIRAEMLRPVG
ncbi:hypothetical protein [Streptomyces sp. NK08204]|uniref:hypothetical protein n=1 Tax=Streptomyces sp. NK08204 TaxID=2873260 RepID=UPI001CEDE672|nr:hypothetical protein [Streptomyces sp. NK08204]